MHDDDRTDSDSIRALIRDMAAQCAIHNAATADAALDTHAARTAGVGQNIRRYWGEALDALTHLILRCVDAVGLALQGQPLDDVDRALLALWARSCQSSFAISVLLSHGFADDALSRWRTVHELNVVAQFLRQHGAVVVERFNAHLAVKNFQVSDEYNRCAPDLKYESIPSSEIATLKAKHDAAVSRYPGLNEGDWAWVPRNLVGVAGKRRVGFAHLERAVGLRKWRAHVGMAHHNVHAGPHGAYFRLSNPKRRGQPLATLGASVFGLATPGDCCAISLHQATLALASPRSPEHSRNPEGVVAAFALADLVGVCATTFANAHATVMATDWTEHKTDS